MKGVHFGLFYFQYFVMDGQFRRLRLLEYSWWALPTFLGSKVKNYSYITIHFYK